MQERKKILVTGGAGYIGAVLVPRLLNEGYFVRVIDNFMLDESIFSDISMNSSLDIHRADIRDVMSLENALKDIDVVIHLAAISNDPSSELNHKLTQQVNYDAVVNLVKIAKDKGVSRFIVASSSSVYGIKKEPEVTEDLPLEPITIYARLKTAIEDLVNKESSNDFVTTCIRKATVCGYSPRMRLDLTVNILSSHAVNKGIITVFGGQQKRPNVHISDVVDLYTNLITAPSELINGDVFNFGAHNYKVIEIAEMVKEIIGDDVKIEITESDDQRSYYISSKKIKERLGYEPKKGVKEAIIDVRDAFSNDLIPDFKNSKYYNVKRMMELNFK